MASFRKRGNVWRVEIARQGKRESATFPTKREAQEWANQRESDLATIKSGEVIRAIFADVMDRYAREISEQKAGKRWEATRIASMQKSPLAKMVMQDITARDLAEWRDQRLKTVQGATVLREIGLLRAIWKHAKMGEWGYVDHNPWLDVVKPKDNPPRKAIFTDEQIKRLAAAMGYTGDKPTDKRQETGLAFLLSLETAMRSGELLALKWGHVHTDKRMLHIPKSKNGDARDVPLSKRAIELLESMRDGDRDEVFTVSPALRDIYFRHAKTLAQIDDLTFHDARATAITRLAKKLDLLELAKMVGHRDPRSLMIYYRESASQIAAKLD